MATGDGQDKARRGRGSHPFWLGATVGALVMAVAFHRQLLELLADAFGNVLPVFFTPGLLELSLGVLGFGLVIVINYLLRREQRDEWVEIEVEEEPGGE